MGVMEELIPHSQSVVSNNAEWRADHRARVFRVE